MPACTVLVIGCCGYIVDPITLTSLCLSRLCDKVACLAYLQLPTRTHTLLEALACTAGEQGADDGTQESCDKTDTDEITNHTRRQSLLQPLLARLLRRKNTTDGAMRYGRAHRGKRHLAHDCTMATTDNQTSCCSLLTNASCTSSTIIHEHRDSPVPRDLFNGRGACLIREYHCTNSGGQNIDLAGGAHLLW